MRFIVTTFLLFSVNFLGKAQDQFLPEFVQKWASATEYTQKVMAAMPQKHYGFKPMKEEMSFEEQLIHMANNMNWLASTFLEIKPYESDFEVKGKSRKEVVQIVNAAMENIQRIASSFDPAQLNDEVDFTAKKLTKRQIFTLLNDHHTHHRAQLLVYLRLKGENPPPYVGW